jgi:hypothetical protein
MSCRRNREYRKRDEPQEGQLMAGPQELMESDTSKQRERALDFLIRKSEKGPQMS